jgi:L-arginine dehydrogenase
MDIQLIDDAEAVAKLDPAVVVSALRSAFAGLSSGRNSQPVQAVTPFPDGAGDCIFYPGALWDLGLAGVKVSPYIAALATQGQPPVTAYTLVLSVETGRPILLCESHRLTTIRTAATTALALEYLISDTAESLAVIGAGPVGIEHLRYALWLRDWASVVIFSPSLAKEEPGSPGRRAALDQVGEVTLAASAEEAVTTADVILLCTSSATPVIELNWLRGNALVTSVGSDGQRAHEVAPADLGQLVVYCDFRQTAPQIAGEMLLAVEHGLWSPDQIAGDLPDLVCGRVSRPDSGRVYFRSTGLGIEDLAIASLLVDPR